MLNCFRAITYELLSTVICFVTFCRKTKLNFTTLYRLSIDFFNFGSFESKQKFLFLVTCLFLIKTLASKTTVNKLLKYVMSLPSKR